MGGVVTAKALQHCPWLNVLVVHTLCSTIHMFVGPFPQILSTMFMNFVGIVQPSFTDSFSSSLVIRVASAGFELPSVSSEHYISASLRDFRFSLSAREKIPWPYSTCLAAIQPMGEAFAAPTCILWVVIRCLIWINSDLPSESIGHHIPITSKTIG